MASVTLPPVPPKPKHYDLVLVHGKIAYLSGQVSRVGNDVIGGYIEEGDDIAQAQEAARVSMRRCLTVLEDRLGGLDKIEQVLSIRCFVAASPAFKRHPEVMDAASELLTQVLGKRGNHVRSALGVSSIPGGGLTEIEMTVAIV